MRKIFIGILISLFALTLFIPAANAGYVNGYFRSNGTYVKPYYRSNPNGLKYDNYSYRSGDSLFNKSYSLPSKSYSSSWYTSSWSTQSDYWLGKSWYDNSRSYKSYNSLYNYPSFGSSYSSLWNW